MWCYVCVVARVFVLYVVARVLCMVAMVCLFVIVFCAVTMVLLCSCYGVLCGHRSVAIGLVGCPMFEGVSNVSVCVISLQTISHQKLLFLFLHQ